MRRLAADALLSAWERGRNRHPLDRALLLYSIAMPDVAPDSLADRPLGQRNAALLELHELMFGDAVSACLDCPNCAERLEFALSATALRGQSVTETSHVEVDGIRFRLPTTRDLAGIAGPEDPDRAAQQLVIALAEDNQVADERAAAGLAGRVASALEEAHPCINVALDVSCPACCHSWSAPFDVAGYLWEEIEARARRLLDEVHVLARAYGWPEREILRLTEARRAAYLERTLA